MRYRAQAADGDFVFLGTSPFLVNSTEAVVQAIRTRLSLYAGEWFLDDRVGFDLNKVLGNNTELTRDDEIKRVISGTKGVTQLTAYSSQVDERRRFTVNATVDTLYGRASITETF